MNVEWCMRWDFFVRRLNMRGIARKYGTEVGHVEQVIRDTARAWRKEMGR